METDIFILNEVVVFVRFRKSISEVDVFKQPRGGRYKVSSS